MSYLIRMHLENRLLPQVSLENVGRTTCHFKQIVKSANGFSVSFYIQRGKVTDRQHIWSSHRRENSIWIGFSRYDLVQSLHQFCQSYLIVRISRPMAALRDGLSEDSSAYQHRLNHI